MSCRVLCWCASKVLGAFCACVTLMNLETLVLCSSGLAIKKEMADTANAAPAGSDGNPIPPERVHELRKAIHAHLQQSNVYGQIRDIIDVYAADNAEFDPNSPDDVMKVVRERGLVNEILSRMQSGAQNPAAAAGYGVSRIGAGPRKMLRGLKPGERYLHLRLLNGRAFLDNIDLEPKVARTQQMVVCIHMGEQRFRCTPQECLVDPPFDDDFLVELERPVNGELLDVVTPLHIVVTKEDCNFARTKFIGENTIEWRKVLKSGFVSLTVELAGDNPGVPSGMLELQLELIPGGARYSEDEIMTKVQNQRSAITAADREFLIYARRWWNEFHQMRDSHNQRKVKVFAATSNGRMVPVSHFVSPILPDRVLDTPLAAARFVSLLSLQKADEQMMNEELVPGSKSSSNPSDVWQSPFVFLTQRRGDSCNHATLLCSLLMGYGLDAYCAVGTNMQGQPVMLVVTRRRVAQGEYDVLLWEPGTGERYQQSGAHPFVTIGCAFNHIDFYANTQDSDNAVTAKFDFADELRWKSMNPMKLRMVPKFPNPPLLWIPLNTRAMEVELEQSMQRIICEHRDGNKLATKWDQGLGYALGQALTAYEQQRVDGLEPDMSLFQSCVKGKIGEGRTFKGFPLNVGHLSERKILATINGAASGREILELHQDELFHAVRVKVLAFPEGVISVWVMLAARYRPL